MIAFTLAALLSFRYIDASLEEQLKTITGVIESGLFINYDIEVVVAG